MLHLELQYPQDFQCYLYHVQDRLAQEHFVIHVTEQDQNEHLKKHKSCCAITQISM